MFEIQLTVDQVLQADEIRFTVDDRDIPFQINGNCIVAQHANQGLVHLLKLQNITGRTFQIQKVAIGGCDLRKLIYLSWMQNSDGQQVQPATEFWQADQIWTLPFGYPLSGWLELVERKIPNDLFGKDLLQQFDFYFPESIKLDSRFPRMVQDFYQHNFSFTVLDKNLMDPVTLPWAQYCGHIADDLLQAARDEILVNTDYIMQHGLSYGQYENNRMEYQIESNAQCWHRVWLSAQRQPAEAWRVFPRVTKLIDSLALDYWYAFIGVLPPGAFIYPHRDYDTFKQNTAEYFPYQGCTQLYIPVQWPSQNYIKFAGVGTLCLDSGQPIIINNDGYTHCLVNNSDQTRIVIGIRAHADILKICRPLPQL